MATWKQPHDNPMSAIEELIERVDKAEADRDRLVEALRKIEAMPAVNGENEAYRLQQEGRYNEQCRWIAIKALEALHA